jgi:transposase
MKLMTEKIVDLRKDLYREETYLNKRKVIKGVRYLLLANGDDVMDAFHRTRLENVLAMNYPLATAYYLKEDLRLFWQQTSKKAELFLRSGSNKQMILVPSISNK